MRRLKLLYDTVASVRSEPPYVGCYDLAVFQIKNPRWADYWQQQAYPMILVIRTADGEIRWLDVGAYLKRESAGGKTVEKNRLRKRAVRCGECAELAEESVGAGMKARESSAEKAIHCLADHFSALRLQRK